MLPGQHCFGRNRSRCSSSGSRPSSRTSASYEDDALERRYEEEQYIRSQRAEHARLDEEADSTSFGKGSRASSSHRPPRSSDRPVSPEMQRSRPSETEYRDPEVRGRFELSLLEARKASLLREMKQAQEASQWAEVAAIGSELTGLELKIGSVTSGASGSGSEPASGRGRGPQPKGISKGQQSGKSRADAKWRRT